MSRLKSLLPLLTLLLILTLSLSLALLPVIPAQAALANGTINGVNVFSNYYNSTAGDWLFTININNTYQPYYLTTDSKQAFSLQLKNLSGTVVAQVPLAQWGYKPGSIYIGKALADALQWGSAYNITMLCVDGNSTSYVLTSADWRGSDLTRLDDWCLQLARSMESYYSKTFVVSTAEKGDVLNEEGGVIFTKGIPYLDKIRSNLFQLTTTKPTWETTTWTGAGEEGLPTWDTAVGSEIASVFNDLGTITSISGKMVGGLLIFGFFIAIAIGGLMMGHGTIGLALAMPILLAGFYLRFIPLAVLGVAMAILLILFVKRFWWESV